MQLEGPLVAKNQAAHSPLTEIKSFKENIMSVFCLWYATFKSDKKCKTTCCVTTPRKYRNLNSLQLYPNSSSTSSSASAGLPGISVSVSVSVSPTWGTTGRRRTAPTGDAFAASRFVGCHTTDGVWKEFHQWKLKRRGERFVLNQRDRGVWSDSEGAWEQLVWFRGATCLAR